MRKSASIGYAEADGRTVASSGDGGSDNHAVHDWPIANQVRIERWFLVACLVLAVIGLIEPLTRLFAHVSEDYGEGFNAYWASAALRGPAELYSSAHVLIADNYPPLSFYLIGELGRVIGDNIFAGRIVALAAMIVTAILAGRIVAILSGSRQWGWITGLLLLTCAEHLFGHFVAVDNPQWLAQAVMLGATYPLIRQAGGPTPRDCMLSAAGVVIAILVKHNLFAFPLAMGLWLAVCHRPALLRWSLWLAGSSAVVAAGLHALYGDAVFIEILAFDRTVDWANFWSGVGKSACFIPMLLIIAASARRSLLRSEAAGAPPASDRRGLLYVFAGLLGLALGIAERSGAGVYTNAHFEALVALVIATGLTCGSSATQWRTPLGARRWRTALLVGVLVPSLIPLPQHIGEWSQQITTRRATQAEWSSTIADVSAAQGRVLCEVPAICYWSHRPSIVDFFAFGQKYRRAHRPWQLYGWIAHDRIAMIILDNSYLAAGREPRLPAPFPGLIGRNYRPIRIIGPDAITELVPRMTPVPAGRTLALPGTGRMTVG